MKFRSREGIIRDIPYGITQGKTSQTQLCTYANLTVGVLKNYLNFMAFSDFIRYNDGAYYLTERGITLLKLLDALQEIGDFKI